MLHTFETISGFFMGLVTNKRHQSRRKLADHLTRSVHGARRRWLCNVISRKLVIAGLKLQKTLKWTVFVKTAKVHKNGTEQNWKCVLQSTEHTSLVCHMPGLRNERVWPSGDFDADKFDFEAEMKNSYPCRSLAGKWHESRPDLGRAWCPRSIFEGPSTKMWRSQLQRVNRYIDIGWKKTVRVMLLPVS